jgi:hypothetical protein
VAVPAQRSAGVLKGLASKKVSLKELADEFGAQSEYRALFKQAQLGQVYEKQLQNEVVRLCLALELGVEEPVLRGVMEKVSAEELMKLKSALEERMRQCMPVVTQLSCTNEKREAVDTGFLI